jgi:hypothetical protein
MVISEDPSLCCLTCKHLHLTLLYMHLLPFLSFFLHLGVGVDETLGLVTNLV